VLLATEDLLAGFTFSAASPEQVVLFHRFRLLTIAFIPGTWLVFSLAYSRGNHSEFLKRWRKLLWLAYAIPVGAVALFNRELISAIAVDGISGEVFVSLGLPGRIVNLVLLAVSVLILVNLERTFRSAVGIMRWRIKYFVLGVALLFGAKFYTSSQALLYGGMHGISLQINAVAVLVAAVLIGYSLLRTKLTESEIYPSHKVLQHSFTAVVAGIYLVGVGLFANVVKMLGGDPSFPIKALVLMVGVVGLTVLVFSDKVRQQISIFVSRNFRRPTHDVPKVWSALTARTASMIDHTELCRAVVKAVSETFELLSVTIWRVSGHDQGLVFGASTSITEEKAVAMLPGSRRIAELLGVLRTRSAPFDIDECKEKWVSTLCELNPDHFHKGGRRICAPLLSGGELVGFITVADRVNGLDFSTEDLDLLKCIGDQVGGSLRNIQLSQKLMQHKEMQAFQTMSAFFVHDLKNTASTLSLMLQNLKTHFGNPAFREDCLKSVSRSVNHINELVQRFGSLRHELELKKTETDLGALLALAVKDLENQQGVAVIKDLQVVPKIQADGDQLLKVATNLLLNAREALNGGGGEIRVATALEQGWVQFSVSDNGCGMSPEFLRGSLFKPFQTTKKSGLGIGMFHSKTIVEAHQGRLEVESRPGVGTTFRVFLPCKS
ncbi:MAG TPA: XrtA/PEP-CTERM system histidine kinase PrsK, partial [Candidatus Eisenbacteria bacterium]|nr:XrtA/PEP-CTERM system histidine kinase PrsK [Candidatus Eisenbacteria bacterium]